MKRMNIHSRVVRLPEEVIKRHAIKEALVLKPRDERQVVRGKPDERLSWGETFQEMAREREDWSDWDVTVADGLDPDEKW
jgi:hypothetical protein